MSTDEQFKQVPGYTNLPGSMHAVPTPEAAPRTPDGTGVYKREAVMTSTAVGTIANTSYESANGVVNIAVDSKKKDTANGKAKKPRGKNLATSIGPGIQVVQRDVFWLEMAARFKWLSYEEMAAFGACSNGAVRQRLYRLIPAGVFDGWLVDGSMNLVTPTNRSASNYDVLYLRPGAGWQPADLLLRHTSAVTRVAMHLWYRDPRAEKYYTVTEREIRAMLRGDGARLFERDAAWASELDLSGESFIVPEAGGFKYSARRSSTGEYISSGYRMPDLVLARKGGLPVAIEVELTAKQKPHYVELFNDYLSLDSKSRFSGVQYYCGSRELKKTLEKIVYEVGGSEFIRVQQFPENMPLPVSQITRITGMRIGEVK